jgi:hypothetical protein
LTLLAKCVQLQGVPGSVQLSDEAHEAWQAVEDEQERALGTGSLTWVLRWDRRYDEAIEMAEEALAVLRRSGDRRLILRGLVWLAHSFADKQDVERTEAILEEADVLAGGDPSWELAAIHGDCVEYRGDAGGAVRLFAENLSWSSTTGDSHQMLMDLRCLAINLSRLGARETALEVFELVRLEEARTGRTGFIPTAAEWLSEAYATARESVTAEAAEAAAARAQAVPASQRAAHALDLAREAVR